MPHILSKFVHQYKKKIKIKIKNKNKVTIIINIIKTSTKLKVSTWFEAWTWEPDQPLQGGSLSPYP